MSIVVSVLIYRLCSPHCKNSYTYWLSLDLLVPNHITQFKSSSHYYPLIISLFTSLICAFNYTLHVPTYPLLYHSISSGSMKFPHIIDMSVPRASSSILLTISVQFSSLHSTSSASMSVRCLLSSCASSSPILDSSSAL